MKINFVTVGKIKSPFKEGVDEYVKRLARFASVSVTELAEASPSKSEAEQIEFESAEILPKMKGYTVVCDVAGKQIDSVALASLVKEKSNGGKSEFTFVVGGSYGISKAVKDRADFLLSFSKMTFPHQLFRVMLSEQVYRAMTILNNMPYHK